MALAASTLTLFGDIASHLVCLKIGMYHYFEDQILGKHEDTPLAFGFAKHIPPHETNMVVSHVFSPKSIKVMWLYIHRCWICKWAFS